jgi:hypothetical protein
MKKPKIINTLHFAKIHAVVLGFLGLIAGILYSFGGFIIDALVSIGWISSSSASTPGLSLGTLLAFQALIGMPILFAIFGFFAGALIAHLHNLISSWPLFRTALRIS